MKKKTNTNPEYSEEIPPQDLNTSEDTLSALDSGAPVNRQRAFRIIGIGSSAGGLEALELFLKNVPPDSGMAFVIVQHQDPTHKGMMVELLQRVTSMKVLQVTDRMTVKPDCVYVIPPGKDMSILHGVLHLLKPSSPRGLRLPIDYFFRCLADDLRRHSVGVILSGMGSDGTLGLRAIKEKTGVSFVQDPADAKFSGMPQSAIEAGLADVVAPVEELPGRIISFIQHATILAEKTEPIPAKTQNALEKVIILLRSHTGYDFSQYKRSTIFRRVERRMSLHQIDKISDYLVFLQKNPQENELLFKELLIGVTNFFRDPEAWEQLKNEGFRALLSSSRAGSEFRAWIPGCSTGEEAYSLAILFREALDKIKPAGKYSLQIFATDLDIDSIEKARQGVYPLNIAAHVTPERLKRFFTQEEYGFRVNKDVREMVIFAQQNLVMDPPFTKLDILVCRNLLIYISPELQKRLIPLFHYCLNPDGILFLGSAETIGSFIDLFAQLEGSLRIYKRLNPRNKHYPVDFPPTYSAAVSSRLDPTDRQAKTKEQEVSSLQTLMDQVLLQRFIPAAVLVDHNGDILYVNGRTGKYLELAAGNMNRNIFAMAREGLRYEMYSAFTKAVKEKDTVVVKKLLVDTNGETQALNLTIQPQQEPAGLQGTVLLIFEDVDIPSEPPPTGEQKHISASNPLTVQLENDLQRAHKEIQTIRSEMQASQEELRSANEELQSANEEMQSTNEELTTSKEEMQSMNEELQTVNNELQSKVEDLSHLNNDMKNLLNSTDIATLFLDDALGVRRFTNQVTKIFKLIPSDRGRLITDIVSDLVYPELVEDVQEVLRSMIFSEKQITTRDGRWFMVRIMPYRTLDNRIDGVVITFLDITIAKNLETQLRENEQEMQALFNHMTNAFALFESVYEADGSISDFGFVYLNTAFEQITGVRKNQVQGNSMCAFWDACDDELIKMCANVAVTGQSKRFEINTMVEEKRYSCSIYRPGESQDRICMILDEIRK